MPLVEMKKFATAATQIHIRTTGDATRSVTSTADTTPILNLRNGIMMNAGTSSGTGSDWTGPFANTTNLSWSCSAYGGGWPQTYQCCGTNGIHIWTLHSRWNWSGGNTSLNEPMQVYVR